MGTARILTDAGKAYCKAMGNPQGPHALACEWVGTQLARWLGLPTFDFAILRLEELDEIPLPGGGRIAPGPAFVTRAETGHTWGGDPAELELLDNPDDVARLVVFDTWTLNCDRHPPDLATRRPNRDNVFLSGENAAPGRFRLVAMDHTHCFTCGRDLNAAVARIDCVREERLFGLFSGFVPLVKDRRSIVQDTAARLGSLDAETCRAMVDSIPPEWEVDRTARTALVRLVHDRAGFVADRMLQWLAPACWPQGDLDFGKEGELT